VTKKPPAALLSAIPFAIVPVLFVISGLVIPDYMSWGSVRTLLLLSALLGIPSIGQTGVIMIGGIDLSIPAIIGLADVAVTELAGYGLPFWQTALIVIAASVVIGLINGGLSLVLSVHPLVVTLATGYIILGGVLAWTHAQYTGTVPAWLVTSSSVDGHVGPIPLPGSVLLWIVLIAAFLFLEAMTVWGKRFYAAGANRQAARLALARPDRIWLSTFVVSALCAAIAGVLYAGFSGEADANVGQALLFQTVTAVVVGGTSLLGGRGGIGRTVGGALIVTELGTLLIGVGLGAPVQQIFLGGLMVVLVALYGREAHVSSRI
jgi:ribose transport system permease protein